MLVRKVFRLESEGALRLPLNAEYAVVAPVSEIEDLDLLREWEDAMVILPLKEDQVEKYVKSGKYPRAVIRDKRAKELLSKLLGTEIVLSHKPVSHQH